MNIAYIVGDFDKPVEQSPVMWFSAEFLSALQQFTKDGIVALWSVDWTNAKCAMARNIRRSNPCHPECVTDVRVMRQTVDGATVIWLLTGEYNWEKDMYEGRWPD